MSTLFNMRIIMSSVPQHGHLLPLLPLARAFADRVEQQGLRLLPAGPMPEALFAEITRRTGADPAHDPRPDTVAEFFAGTRVDLSVDEALEAVKGFTPDLVVVEACDFVGPMVAAASNVPVATLAFGPPMPPAFTEAMDAMAQGRHERRGLPLAERRWVLDTWPASMQAAQWRAPQGWLPLRPEAFRVPGDAAEKLPAPVRPRVLVTFGTYFGEPALLSPLVRGLSELDAEVVVTLGLATRAEEFDVDPGRVTFVGFTPLEDLLDGVDVVVTHGGAGTTAAALTKGVPLVVLPQGADQFFQAERVAATGTGVALLPPAQTPEALVDAVRGVLTDAGIRENVTAIAEEIAAMPSAHEVAVLLEEGR
jgi:UDP:flavonoid glycosyltransferase YjiC (YdhE family)